MRGGGGVSYLVSGRSVRGHVTLQLGVVAEAVAAQRAADALLVPLVPVLDVLLQGRQALVAALAVRTREHLGEGVGGAGRQVCGGGVLMEVLESIFLLLVPVGQQGLGDPGRGLQRGHAGRTARLLILSSSSSSSSSSSVSANQAVLLGDQRLVVLVRL
ncbi:hypothetical protein EYF80_061674 [Liparis tanakae]|uniref:Uncharacterized protein n=1 Tax=Liparis tanakae TaxID=230148 RepID=A0A4Z2EHX7_9TELE|nr:hypothetical protein EYF80_061674 [Liparis tanakae]